MKIDRERTGWRITARCDETAAELRERMQEASEKMPNMYVPSDLICESGTYTFYIRNRQSLQTYLCEYGITIGEFVILAERTAELFAVSEKAGVSPYDFIFDYDCIFIEASFANTEFVYAPEPAETVRSCADMLALVSLYIRTESEEAAEAVKSVILLLQEWEAGEHGAGKSFPAGAVRELLAQWNEQAVPSLIGTWKPFAFFQAAALVLSVLLWLRVPFHKRGALVWVVWLLFMLCLDMMLIPGLDLRRCMQGGRGADIRKQIRELFSSVSNYFIKFFKKKQMKAVKKEARILPLQNTEQMHSASPAVQTQTAALRIPCLTLTGRRDFQHLSFSLPIDCGRPQEFRIGRDASWAAVRIPHRMISRKHAMLHFKNGTWYLRDLSSTNGTQIGLHPLCPDTDYPVTSGTEVCFGKTPLCLILDLP